MRKTLPLFVILLVFGCISPNRTKPDTRHSKSSDFRFELLNQYEDGKFHLTLQNISQDRIWHNYFSRCFTVWVIHEEKNPIQLFDFASAMSISPNPLPVMEPKEKKEFEIIIESLGVFEPKKLNLKNALIFVEYSVKEDELFSNSIKYHKNTEIGKGKLFQQTN